MCKHRDFFKALCMCGQVVGGRTIAVDWAVSKAQFQSASAADKPGELQILNMLA